MGNPSCIPIPKSCKSCTLYSIFSTIETLFITFLVASAFLSIVKDGMNMDGDKGYISSLIPTVPISIFLWIIKRKYFRKKMKNQRELQPAIQLPNEESSSSDEEIVILPPSHDSSP